MTTATSEVMGSDNVSVHGDVHGDVNMSPTHFYGTGSGYRDIIVRDEIAPGHVAWLASRFAQPGGYADALAKLRDEEGTVFLTGQPGSDEETQLDVRRIPPGAHVLLDLTGTDDAGLRAVEDQLKNFLGTVAAAHGRLAVLMSGREGAGLLRLVPPGSGRSCGWGRA